MVAARHKHSSFPHIDIRTVLGEPEPYIPGTGLSVWEIVWLWRGYNGDLDALTRHLEIDSTLIEEAIEYWNAHPEEIDPAVHEQETRGWDYLKSVLPGIQAFPPWPDDHAD